MPSTAPTAVAPHPASAPPATALKEPPPQDGWSLSQTGDQPGGLSALRAELDQIDDQIHDLLIARARVVEKVAVSGKRSAFRPGREASIVRRLLARHTGKLPPVTLFRMWREMLAGTTAMQATQTIAVCESGAGSALTQLSREHFGALTPLRTLGSAGQALSEVANGTAACAVLPMPSEADAPRDAWWVGLTRHEPRMHVIARLPFWSHRPEGAPTAQALVVAAAAPDQSEHDRSLLALELDADTSRARLAQELAAIGLKPETMVLWRPPGGGGGYALAEVDGYVPEDDARLNALPRRIVVLGGYAVPYQALAAAQAV